MNHSLKTTLVRGAIAVGITAALVVGAGVSPAAHAATSGDGVFASSDTTPALQFPEGLVAYHGLLYTATYNVADPSASRILEFNASSGALVRTLGGKPGQELISQNVLLGLTVNQATGDLYVAANGIGKILCIQNPDTSSPTVSVFATYPSGGGPEDLAFGPDGALYASDSNLGVVYRITQAGGAQLLIGPPKTGAPISDRKLFAAAVAGLSPNGLVFSQDGRTLFVANTYADRIVAFSVNAAGQVQNDAHVFAENHNPDMELYPYGFEGALEPDTQIGASATTPLNGPDGLELDPQGRLWASCVFGDNETVLDPHTGAVIEMVGNSANTQGGLLNSPTNAAFANGKAFVSNMGIFSSLPFTIAQFDLAGR